jgi:hypothetical protein
MRAIDALGEFWLPSHEDDTLSGRLQFDPKGDGINLSLVGVFDKAPNDSNSWFRILGWIGNDRVTLDRCFSRGPNIRSPGIDEGQYSANQMFVGHHFEQDQLAFQSVAIRLSDLDSWIGRSGIVVETDYSHIESRSHPIYEMAFTPLPDETCPFSRGQLGLRFGWKPSGDPIHGIGFRQWPGIVIEYDQMQPFEVIQKDVDRIQDLVTLCIDAPTSLDSLVVWRPDIQARALSGKEVGVEQRIEWIAQPIRYVDPEGRRPRHWHQMLLTFDELGGIDAIARWLDASHRFQRALNSFMSIKHAKQMFAENRFLNVTFAAEAIHRIITGPAPYMDEETFNGLLGVYLENTHEEHHDWLRGRIRNEPPLRKRLLGLATRAGPATRPLIGDKESWAHTLTQVRNELTHLANDSRIFEGADLIFLTESVYAVVRICMLMECGVSPKTLTEKANSSTVAWYRDRLKGALKNVRSQLASQ